jgi:uncharacterized protein YggE
MTNEITVIGTSEYILKPDYYEIEIEVRLKGGVKFNGRPDADKKSAREVAVSKLLSVLTDHQIEENQIVFLGTHDLQEWQRKKGYQTKRATCIQVKHSDINVIASIAGWIEGETFQDVEVRVGGLKPHYSNSVEAEALSFAQAFANARQVAKTISSEAETALGGVVSINDKRVEAASSDNMNWMPAGAVAGSIENFDFNEQMKSIETSLVVKFLLV